MPGSVMSAIVIIVKFIIKNNDKEPIKLILVKLQKKHITRLYILLLVSG